MSRSTAPLEIRTKLERVLKDKRSLMKSAAISFEQFDKDKSGSLDFQETQELIRRLCKNLALPPVDDSTLERVFVKYDDGDGQLTIEEFARMYWDLLLRIRDKYFPKKTMVVRRSFFVGRTSLSHDKKISDVFDVEKKLGAGSFGQVYLVRERSTELVRVCKTIMKDKAVLPPEQIEAEIEFMKTLDHPNIIKIYEVYEDYNNIYIIMENCKGGELMDRIAMAQKAGRRLNEKYVANIMRQMLEALAYFHSQKIVHKDMKPENVMFEDHSIDSPLKVIDFGVAEMFTSDVKSHNAAGTALYMAPEVYKRCFGLKCDVWSAGCILYLLLSGRLPFMGRGIAEVQKKVCEVDPPIDQDCKHASEHARDLLRQMLQKDPKKRPNTLDVLKHPWFTAKKADGEEGESEVVLPPAILDNMHKYMKQSGLKNALVNMITHQLGVNSTQVRSIIKLFRTLDKDGNGTLSPKELQDGLANAGWPQWDINRVIQSLDVDDNGDVAYTEFLAACYTWQEEEINQVWSAAFNKMDAQGDGQIPVDSMIAALSGGDARFGDKEEVEKMIADIDKDGNGFVDWDEFLSYIRG